jgi:hypothetical protein
MPLYEIVVQKGGLTFQVQMEADRAEDVLHRARQRGYEPARGRAKEVQDGTPPDIRAIKQLSAARRAFVKGTMSFDELRATYEGLAADRKTAPIVEQIARDELEQIRAATDPEAIRQAMERENQEARRKHEGRRREAQNRGELMRARNPRGYTGDRTEIAPGWLKEPHGERFGILCLGPPSDLVWVDLDPSSQEPQRVQVLCPLRDFERIRKSGLFRPRVTLRATGGRAWEIRLDRRRLTDMHRAMIGSGLVMHIIQEDLEPVQISWGARG